MNIPFDALATFFIFLIGVPALVIQNQKSELRRIALHRGRRLVFRAGLWILLALGLIAAGVGCDILWKHDASNPETIGLPVVIGDIQTVPEAAIWLVVCGVLVVISILATVSFLWWYGGYRGLLRDLQKEIVKPIRARRDKVPYPKSEPLAEVIELGRQSDAGQDKEQTLQMLFKLACEICAHPKYRGDSLEQLVEGLVLVVGADPKVGSSQNFESAAKLIEHILTRDLHAVADSRSDDVSYSIRVASQLGRQAARQLKAQIEVEATLTVYLETLDLAADKYPKSLTDVSQALYELGSAALDEQQTFTAMGAVNKLIVLFENTNPPQNELTADLLALMAHFWENGETAKLFVRQQLASVREMQRPSLPDALAQAQYHCAVTSRFHTADLIAKMTRALESAPLTASN